MLLQVLLNNSLLFPGKMVQQREKAGSDFILRERLEGLSYPFSVSSGKRSWTSLDERASKNPPLDAE
jgi:hypothetical protein